MKNIFSCESVSKGHPDKAADQIADAILDECLKIDSNARCAIECLITKDVLILGGEVSLNGYVNFEKVARNALKSIGYSSSFIDFDPEEGKIVNLIKEQSPDIYQAVFKEEIAAGDQGIMFGYATNETKEFLPLPFVIANKLLEKADSLRKQGLFKYAKTDMKSQVSYDYDRKNITCILISIQHSENYEEKEFRNYIKNEIVYPLIKEYNLNEDFNLIINPSGKFIIGGPAGDTGVTGRKIVADSYGGIARCGGGAFSGKDPSKVDRSAAYMARYICKNLVAANLVSKCELQIGYAIGIKTPISIHLETYGTENISKDMILEIISKTFDLSVQGIIKHLRLQTPIYSNTSCYGHFGKNNLPWEKLDKVEEIKSYVDNYNILINHSF
ncbi:MAG: methionine adenosyltransferase [Erysipelotrichaceae bacterium]|nr:methionine adenosyltransferase [Erysipelotrichaceae bacterium]